MRRPCQSSIANSAMTTEGKRVAASRTGPLAVVVLLLALATGFGSAAAETAFSAIPGPERCRFLELRIEDGWWLQLRRDGPAAYGFGALPQRVLVEGGTFAFDEVYAAVIGHLAEAQSGARVTVVFSPMAAGFEGQVFALKDADTLASELFATAYRRRDLDLDDGFQQQNLRHLDPFWADAPFLR